MTERNNKEIERTKKEIAKAWKEDKEYTTDNLDKRRLELINSLENAVDDAPGKNIYKVGDEYIAMADDRLTYFDDVIEIDVEDEASDD